MDTKYLKVCQNRETMFQHGTEKSTNQQRQRVNGGVTSNQTKMASKDVEMRRNAKEGDIA